MKKSKIALLVATALFASSGVYAASKNNEATVSQAGGANTATVTQVDESNDNISNITQVGNNNAATTEQARTANSTAN
ncbi:MAG: beta strand repeat-containing protein, partial [Shewanella sp.]